MSTLAVPRPTHTLVDSLTMVRRSLLRLRRYPSLTIMLIVLPLIFLLLFVYVLGGTLGAGLGGGRADYLAYVVPGILIMTAASTAQGTAITVAMDMTEGVVARFRTMSIARVAVLTGHVAGAVVQTLIAQVVVLGVALLLGFRPDGGVPGVLAAFGVLAVIGFALAWLSVALGMVSRSVETASNLPMPLVFLPFLSSGFVPTTSMPAGLQWFAAHQPFTPMIETVRGLLTGTPVPASTLGLALGWAALVALIGYLVARRLYETR
ncbi:ABC transporter permease [Actinomycetospora sp. NBC_00405]|uniref:ABC transporter permease n=1 Tax=Actinomycetospora sp. NBC_00405 TaxID=2975952 RepID=UPI002E1C414E